MALHHVFSYGSNSLAQLRARVENPALQSRAASVRGFVRVFCLTSGGWCGGGVASLTPLKGARTTGSIVSLTSDELSKLEMYEGGYRQVAVVCVVGATRAPCNAIAFIAGKPPRFGRGASPAAPFTPTMSVEPHEVYLCAIHCHLREHYDMRSETIAIRSVDACNVVRVVREWHHPGVAQLSLAALCVEVNARHQRWKMPRTIPEVLRKLAAIGCDDSAPAAQLLAPHLGGPDLAALNVRLQAAGELVFGPATLNALRALLCGATGGGGAAAAPPSVPAPAACAIFAYGTLRSDFLPEGGDRWGVCAALAAAGHPLDVSRAGRAAVSGFDLYQEGGRTYPFAVRRPGAGRLVGTLLAWVDAGAFAQALRKCDEIEGFDAAHPTSGLYLRDVVHATPLGGGRAVAAYVYHQQRTSDSLRGATRYANGDWLQRNSAHAGTSVPI
jgi:gamma-glutamylcyclotransferase (GGCT)/AIG2-like uncharacterized protein YtfP